MNMLFQVLFLFAAVSASLVGTSAPSNDSFYEPPSNLSEYGEGEVIRKRNIEPLTFLVEKSQVSQVLYRTNNTKNQPSHSVATIIEPWWPSSEPKLLSFQMWEDSSGANCAPSFSIANSLASPNALTSSWDVPPWFNWALAQGYYIVAPDHEGAKNAFFAGYEEGRSGLDGIRAAISELGLPSNVSTVLSGYSGGGHATAWMLNLLESYGSGLNVIGAAYGGNPVDFKTTFDKINAGFFSGFTTPCVAGLLTVYDIEDDLVDQYFDDYFRQAISKAKSPNQCLIPSLLSNLFTNFTEHTSEYLLDIPFVSELHGYESLLSNVSTVGVSVPKIPRYVYHAVDDEIVPYETDKLYVQQQCDAGADIQWTDIYFPEHLIGMLVGAPGAMNWIKDVFDGTLSEVGCGQSGKYANMTVDSPNLEELIGKAPAQQLLRHNNTELPWGGGNVSFSHTH